jgi:hypothetical protein
MQDLVLRDEPISRQLKDEAAKLKDIVLTEVRPSPRVTGTLTKT